MFRGEKTRIFWWGIIILGLAVSVLFSIIWYGIILPSRYVDLRTYVPQAFGSVVFLLIGLYMMISGVRKPEATT